MQITTFLILCCGLTLCIANLVSQNGSSSSSPATSGCHEEQEQVVVARFLASLNPAESSNSPQTNQQKGQQRPSTTCRNPFPSTTSAFNNPYQNWASSNVSPETALYYMWMQEQAAVQQRRLMPLPFPVPPVLPHGQILPWMHSMLQPSHHPYGITGEQQPRSVRPEISTGTTISSLCFSNQSVPDPIKSRSMVTIQEIQEEKPENSKLSPADAPTASSLGSNDSEVTRDENLKKDDKQETLPQTRNVTSAPLEVQENGSLEWASTRCMNSGAQSDEARLQNSLGFESRPNIRLNHAPTASYCGNAGMALPPASQAAPMRPTQNFRTPVTAPRMQSGRSSYTVRPTPGRMQFGGLHSPFMAPAVQIRSVVPVCSAAPPRRMTSSSQERPPSDNAKNGTPGDISIMNSKLGNLHL